MKKIILFLLLSLTLFGEDTYKNDFKVGISTNNLQDSEGTSFYLGYRVYKNFMIDTSYNTYYLRAVKVGDIQESWNEFITQRLGIRWYLASYNDNKIKLFTSLGAEYVYKNDDLSSEDAAINTYGLAGVEFDIVEWVSISFSMGSSGKGLKADKMKESPSYAHGFNTSMAVEFNF